MFMRDPGDKLDLALEAATLVGLDVRPAQKEQNPRFSIDDPLEHADVPVLLVSRKDDGIVHPARQHDTAGEPPYSREVILLRRGAYAGDRAPGPVQGEFGVDE